METECDHRILGQRTSCWLFRESATAETFRNAFSDFNKVIHRPEIDRLLIELRMPETFLGKEIQEIFLETGEIAQRAGIVKWGVVADAAKLGALRFLVRGGAEGGREYEFLVSDCAEEVTSWIELPLGSGEASAAAETVAVSAAEPVAGAAENSVGT